MRVTGPQQVQKTLEVVFVNQAHVLHLHRVGQQRQAGRLVLDEGAVQERHVQAFDVQGHVGQRVIGDQVEGHVGVAEGQVEIDEGNAVVRILGQGAAEVDGEAGAADAAARAEDGDDLRGQLRLLVGPPVRCRPCPPRGWADGAGRVEQLFEDDGLGQEELGPALKGLEQGLARRN